MNNVTLVGRLTRDPETRMTKGDNPIKVAHFTVAVDRPYRNNQENTADFISCTAFGKSAEFIEKYFNKGKLIGIQGRIQTGSYTNNEGVKIYTTDVVVNNVEFVGSKSDNASSTTPATPSTPPAQDDFMNIPEEVEEELPFI